MLAKILTKPSFFLKVLQYFCLYVFMIAKLNNNYLHSNHECRHASQHECIQTHPNLSKHI
jgi:hypothetical protein